jgi:prenylcysteine oxidase/farnesylcysteine lyase
MNHLLFNIVLLIDFIVSIRVAVIGGGISGASTAYHLRHFAKDIVVFEANDRVGGRIEHVRLNGDVDIEVGASMWVRENRLLMSLVRELELRAVRRDEMRRSSLGVYSSGLSGIWNGRQFVFQSSVWRWLAPLRALWRYGLAPLDVQRLVDSAVSRFTGIYDEPVWNSTATLFERLRLVNETQSTLASLLQWSRVPQHYIDELASVAVRVNYGQSERRISAFAGLITLVAMSSECFQLDGGNVQLVEAMLRAANATVRLRTPARSIEREQSIWQRVRSAVLGGGERDARFRVNGEPFDYVVIATPLELAPALRLPSRGSMRAFQTTHTVIVSGVPAVTFASTLGVESVLTTEAASEQAAFTSFVLQFRYDNGTAVYKVFARKEIADETLREVFDGGVFTVHFRRAWRAYPVLSPVAPADWSTTVVDEDGVIYANAIESAVSTMETAALSGRNAARWIEQKELKR